MYHFLDSWLSWLLSSVYDVKECCKTFDPWGRHGWALPWATVALRELGYCKPGTMHGILYSSFIRGWSMLGFDWRYLSLFLLAECLALQQWICQNPFEYVSSNSRYFPASLLFVFVWSSVHVVLMLENFDRMLSQVFSTLFAYVIQIFSIAIPFLIDCLFGGLDLFSSFQRQPYLSFATLTTVSVVLFSPSDFLDLANPFLLTSSSLGHLKWFFFFFPSFDQLLKWLWQGYKLCKYGWREVAAVIKGNSRIGLHGEWSMYSFSRASEVPRWPERVLKILKSGAGLCGMEVMARSSQNTVRWSYE